MSESLAFFPFVWLRAVTTDLCIARTALIIVGRTVDMNLRNSGRADLDMATTRIH